MKINCIIPVYNVKRYIKPCLDSILSQTYSNYEIILIDDCSSDGSLDICRAYTTKYPQKVILIKKQINEGVDKARFTGLNYVLNKNTSDEGVVFVDSDDYLDRDSFKNLVEEMQRTNADIVEMGFNRVLGPIKRKNPFRVKPGTITNPELFDKYYISFFGKNLLSVNCCGKLYRVSTLKKARLKPTGYKMGEDLMFNLMLFPSISTYSIINYNGYNYRIGGLTSHYNPSLWTDLKSQFIEKRNEAILHNYQKGLRLLSIELKNIFLSAIQQRIIYLNEPESNLTNWIRQELESHIWDDIIIMAPNESDPIYQYIADKDASLILNIAKSRVKSTAFRRLVKKTLSLIIR